MPSAEREARDGPAETQRLPAGNPRAGSSRLPGPPPATLQAAGVRSRGEAICLDAPREREREGGRMRPRGGGGGSGQTLRFKV